MSKVGEYRSKLSELHDWEDYLLKESGLPGPRANLELAQAVADEGDLPLFRRYSANPPDAAPVNSPQVFLVVCGIIGLGRLLAEGDTSQLKTLRKHASDPRWRVREAVAMALQRLGDTSMPKLISAMRDWIKGAPLEQRAAIAALCEPRLLAEARHARAVLEILDETTRLLEQREERRDDDVMVLRKGLGYCWSVAVVALPEEGKPLMEKWLVSPDKDIRWIMKENLRKTRLTRMDAEWVRKWRGRME